MLIKIFSRGKGAGDAPINYLLGEHFMASGMQPEQLRQGAKILSGNPLITQELINSSNFAKRYTSGVLSFEESPDTLSDDAKQKIIADFEKMMFPGMSPDRYNFLWVEHTDKLHPETGKPRLELNFLIPTTELYTGKRLQPYFHAQDAKYFKAWQTLTNNLFELSDPDDVTHRRLVNPFDSNQSPKKSAQQLKTDIEAYIRIQMDCGLIHNRQDVIAQLEAIPKLGIQVTRQTAKSLSVISEQNQKPIRLKGFVFDADFDFANYRARMQLATAEPNQAVEQQVCVETLESKQQRVERALTDFKAIYTHKAGYNQKKYTIPDEEVSWVTEYYAPEFLNNSQFNEMAAEISQLTQSVDGDSKNDVGVILDKADVAVTIANPTVQTLSEGMGTPQPVEQVSNASLGDKFNNPMTLVNVNRAKLIAEKVAADKKRGQLALAAAEQQRLVQEKKIKSEQAREEQRRIRAIAQQMGEAVNYCSRLGAEAYDLGYKKLRRLLKDHFILAVNQNQSGYMDTLRLEVGRFSNALQVTKDGRVGIDDSAYSNVTDIKFLYSSDVFELKQDRLYFKNTDVFYELSQVSQGDRALLQESLRQSELNKQALLAEPSGLAGAFVTYSAAVKVLPNQYTAESAESTPKESGLAGAFVTYHADVKSLPPKRDDEAPGF